MQPGMMAMKRCDSNEFLADVDIPSRDEWPNRVFMTKRILLDEWQ
jgi:hypothetical protein